MTEDDVPHVEMLRVLLEAVSLRRSKDICHKSTGLQYSFQLHYISECFKLDGLLSMNSESQQRVLSTIV